MSPPLSVPHLLVLLALLLPATNLRAELLVVVGAHSSLTGLTLNQAKDLFLGRITCLPNGEAAAPLDQADGSSLREAFYLKVTRLTTAQAKAHWAKLYFTGRGIPPKEGANGSEIKQLLNRIPASISYIEKADFDNTVKVLLSVP